MKAVLRRLTVCLLALALAPAAAPPASAQLTAYGADRKLSPGALPQGGAEALTMLAPIGGFADGQIAVPAGSGGDIAWDPVSDGNLVARATLLKVARTRVRGKLVPDPLAPVGPKIVGPAVLFVRISTDGLESGVYGAVLRIGQETMPLWLNVSSWEMPPREQGFRTMFLIQPQSYFQAIDRDHPVPVARKANRALFDLLASYRIAPGDWGYANPTPNGYTTGQQWQQRKAALMRIEAGFGFNTMRLPLSTQKQASGRWLGGAAPDEPETWQSWLDLVSPFWLENNWTDRAVAYTWDEPGRRAWPLLARQALAVHTGFPEAQLMTTASPSDVNRSLWDGGTDDVDIWSVLCRRFYGVYDHPLDGYRLIQAARAAGKEIWSYTYHGVPGSPGYDATEPLTDIRLFFAWNALEETAGTFYADNLVAYKGHDPWHSLPGDGQSVFIYPGPASDPVPRSSLRLEALRDGIQDANVFESYALAYGREALIELLGRHGLFAVSGGRLLLGCTSGCDRVASTRYSFPIWQRNAYRASSGLAAARAEVLNTLGPIEQPSPEPAPGS
jgi:hypothetical protein